MTPSYPIISAYYTLPLSVSSQTTSIYLSEAQLISSWHEFVSRWREMPNEVRQREELNISAFIRFAAAVKLPACPDASGGEARPLARQGCVVFVEAFSSDLAIRHKQKRQPEDCLVLIANC